MEQEILHKYAHKLMREYLALPEEDVGKGFEKVRSLWQKLQTGVLVEKGEELFLGLEAGLRRDFMLEAYC